MKNNMACSYFPTTIFFIDDKEKFLQSLVLHINPNTAYAMHTNPHKALDLVIKSYQHNVSKHRHLLQPDPERIDAIPEEHVHTLVDINISNIHKAIHAPERFQEIAVVVVDYSMPGMNGLELAQYVKEHTNNTVKILMVTGEADNDLAVKAFNSGIIDRFIKKSAVNFYSELNKSIQELQNAYFYDLSKSLIESLATDPNCCLNDPTFIKLFHEICVQHHIVEYYLVNTTGSYLMLDITGKVSWLIIESEEMVQEYQQIAEDYFAPKDVQESLKKRQKIPFFFDQADLEAPIEEWAKKYLHPATELIGIKNKYYYTIIKKPNAYNIDNKKIDSYQSYLDSMG